MFLMATTKAKTDDDSARAKGRLVESIVAAMHRAPGVKVTQNVRMPVIGDAKRTSEIDVLMNGAMGGYPAQIAFECKNEQGSVGTPKINAFIGKLQDVGIPTQQAVFVAATRFTKGAISRAKKVGMQTLVLTGLTQDRVAAAVEDAFQAAIHLWLVVTKISVVNGISSIDTPEQLAIFYDTEGKIIGSLADLIWRKWFVGEIPATAGEHPVVLELPLGWRHVIRGSESIPDQMHAKVHVHAFVTTFPGAANRHTLVDAASGQVSRMRVNATFNRGPASVEAFASEEALQQSLSKTQAGLTVKTRSRLPRIQVRDTLWPPSAKLIEALNTAFANHIDPSTLKPEELDPPSLESMWERVWHSPMLEGILHARFK